MNDSETEPRVQLPLRLVDLRIDAGQQTLLENTNVTIPGGKITVIVGGSGAGKSVLLRTLAGLLPGEPVLDPAERRSHGEEVIGPVGHDS